MGHEDISTTEIYLHVAMEANGIGVESPLDTLDNLGVRPEAISEYFGNSIGPVSV